MGKHSQRRDEWLQDINLRQRNVVFADTLQNETRFWRNFGTQPWTTTTKIGFALLALTAVVFGTVGLAVIVQAGRFWLFALIMLLVWLPIFCAISWAARRALRQTQKNRCTHEQ